MVRIVGLETKEIGEKYKARAESFLGRINFKSLSSTDSSGLGYRKKSAELPRVMEFNEE